MNTLTIFLVFCLTFKVILGGGPSYETLESFETIPNPSPKPCDKECENFVGYRERIILSEEYANSFRGVIEMNEFLASQARRNAAAETDPAIKKALENDAIGFDNTARQNREWLPSYELHLKPAQGEIEEAIMKLIKCKNWYGIPATPPCDDCSPEKSNQSDFKRYIELVMENKRNATAKKLEYENLAQINFGIGNLPTASYYLKLAKDMADFIEVTEFQIMQFQRRLANAEANLKACLENNDRI